MQNAQPISPDSAKPLVGLGGWLILIGIVIIFTFLRSVTSMITLFMVWSSPEQLEIFVNSNMLDMATAQKVLLFEGAANLLLAALFLMILIRFYQRHCSLPKLYQIGVWCCLAFAVIDVGLMFYLFNFFHWNMLLRWGVICAVTVPYIRRSKRVHNTFVNGCN